MLRASAAMARVGVSALPRMSTAVSVARASKAAAGSRHASFLLGRNGLQASRRSVPAQSRGMAAEAAAAVFDLSGGEPTLTALALLFLLFATEKMTSKGKKDEEEKETEKAAAAAASAPAAQAPVPAPETRVQKVVDFGKEKAIKLSEKAHELKMKADADAAQVVGAIKAAGKDVDEHGRKLLKDAKESADALAARAEARLADAVAAGKEAAEKANAEGEKLAAGAVEAIHKAQLESDRLAKEAKVAASTAAEKLSRQAEEAAAQAAAAAAEARRQAERALDKARTDIPMPEHDFVDRMERAAGALSALRYVLAGVLSTTRYSLIACL